MHQRQRRDDLGDLRQPEQALEADDLDRHTDLGESVEHLRGVGVVTHQHADLRPRHPLVGTAAGAGLLDRASRPGELLVRRLVHRHIHGALARCGLGDQPRDGGATGIERLCDGVGGLEDAPVGAAVHRQGEGRRSLSGQRREVLGESQDVGDRGPPPAVDRLIRIAHRRDGVAATGRTIGAGEQRREHARLCHRGVLILVEEHHAVLPALGRTHLGVLERQPRGERHLVGEVHEAEPALHGAVVLDEAEQLSAPGHCREGVLAALLLPLADLESMGDRRCQLVVEATDVRGLAEVLGELGLQREQVLHDRRGVVAELVHLAAVGRDGALCQLEARAVGDDAGVGLVPQPQPVLVEQRGGVGVVRRHRRLEGLGGRLLPRARQVGSGRLQQPGAGQRPADAGGELGRRLRREGQAEHLLGSDQLVGDEVDDARSHQRRLAGSGAGDDDRGRQRRGHCLPLLGAEREVLPHELAQILGAAHPQRRAHDSTVPEV